MQEKRSVFTPKVVIQVLLFVVVIGHLPLLISGRWSWWEAWVFAGLYLGSFLVSRLLVARRHPDLLAERARFSDHEDAEPWDRLLAPLVALGGGLVPLLAGMQVRYGTPSGFALWVELIALALTLAGYWLGTWALLENRFFSGVVRIQAERGHRVVSTGPYSWVRHPGYAGGLLVYLTTPFLLDAWWALVPAVLLSVALVVRTGLEDRTLQGRLEGYGDYARRVRYRLLPGLW